MALLLMILTLPPAHAFATRSSAFARPARWPLVRVRICLSDPFSLSRAKVFCSSACPTWRSKPSRSLTSFFRAYTRPGTSPKCRRREMPLLIWAAAVASAMTLATADNGSAIALHQFSSPALTQH